jgi:hypothetical protein
MGTHMKTTIEMADGLLADAKRVAAEEGTTLRALLEEGLRASLPLRAVRTSFRLRDASFRGEGLQEAFGDADWSSIRAAAYKGRGS